MHPTTWRGLLLAGLAVTAGCFNAPDWLPGGDEEPAGQTGAGAANGAKGSADANGDQAGTSGANDVDGGGDAAGKANGDGLEQGDVGADPGGGFAICLSDGVTTAIDGAFTGWPAQKPHEWSCAGPAVGVYSYVYMRYTDGRLQILNDWILRDDQDICPAMYNLFWLTTGGGTQQWEIRVYGDGHGETLLDGKPYKFIESAYGFRDSPHEQKPHTIFEFVLGVKSAGVLAGPWVLMNHDPQSAAALQGAALNPSSPIVGCDDPDGALVAEPTVFTGVLAKNGQITASTTTAPTLGYMLPVTTKPGETVTVHGGNLGTTGTLTVGGVQADIGSWKPNRIVFTVPSTASGITPVEATCADDVSNTVKLTVITPKPVDCKLAATGTACADGLACTADDKCKAGACAGVLACNFAADGVDATCAKPLECTADGSCTYQKAMAGPCKDGDACTQDDTCALGQCKGLKLQAWACDDKAPCSVDSCDKTSGCTHTWLNSGLTCDDGDPCTQGETCDANQGCNGNPFVCDDSQLCTVDSCVPKQGCTTSPGTGVPCQDGNACTAKDACFKGTCAGEALDCNDGKPCTADACAPTQGCTHTQQSPGLSCDDGNACTLATLCDVAGSCVGIPQKCDDGDPCTTDGCDAKSGCTFEKTCKP